MTGEWVGCLLNMPPDASRCKPHAKRARCLSNRFEQISRRLCSVLRRAPDFSPGRQLETLAVVLLRRLKSAARQL